MRPAQRRRQPLRGLGQRRALPRRVDCGRRDGLAAGAVVNIHTEAGDQGARAARTRRAVAARFAPRWGSRSGSPACRSTSTASASTAITLRVGNPQCVVLGERHRGAAARVAAGLAVHPHFPEGHERRARARSRRRDRVRILIWERGVGPTEASGTGACAAAVAAIRYGGAARDVEVDRRRAARSASSGWTTGRLPDRLGGARRRGRWLRRTAADAEPARSRSRPVEAYSPAEELFNRRRRTAGLIGGPLVLVALLLAADADRGRRRTASPPSSR